MQRWRRWRLPSRRHWLRASQAPQVVNGKTGAQGDWAQVKEGLENSLKAPEIDRNRLHGRHPLLSSNNSPTLELLFNSITESVHESLARYGGWGVVIADRLCGLWPSACCVWVWLRVWARLFVLAGIRGARAHNRGANRQVSTISAISAISALWASSLARLRRMAEAGLFAQSGKVSVLA